MGRCEPAKTDLALITYLWRRLRLSSCVKDLCESRGWLSVQCPQN